MSQHTYSESETRARFITPQLIDAGWDVTPFDLRHEVGLVIGQGREGSMKYADYVLDYNGKAIAVVEAKRYDRPAQEGIQQVVAYARSLGARFAYTSNGREIIEVDIVQRQQRRIQRFPAATVVLDRVNPTNVGEVAYAANQSPRKTQEAATFVERIAARFGKLRLWAKAIILFLLFLIWAMAPLIVFLGFAAFAFLYFRRQRNIRALIVSIILLVFCGLLSISLTFGTPPEEETITEIESTDETEVLTSVPGQAAIASNTAAPTETALPTNTATMTSTPAPTETQATSPTSLPENTAQEAEVPARSEFEAEIRELPGVRQWETIYVTELSTGLNVDVTVRLQPETDVRAFINTVYTVAEDYYEVDQFFIIVDDGEERIQYTRNGSTWDELRMGYSAYVTIEAPEASAQDQLQEIAEREVTGDVLEIMINEWVPAIVINYQMAEGFGGYNIDHTEREMARLACAIKTSGIIPIEYTYQFSAMIGLVDSFGNESSDDGVTVRLMGSEVERINCENVDLINLPNIAESWLVHPALTR